MPLYFIYINRLTLSFRQGRRESNDPKRQESCKEVSSYEAQILP